MAKRVTITLVDDLDGVAHADETIEFELDGVSYAIDLSARNAERLRHDLSVWIDRARRVHSRAVQRGEQPGPRRRTTMDRLRGKAIREWAQRNGHQIAAHGRISAEIIEAYQRNTKLTGKFK
ncbi:histone-like nucleoid-structuring protein Lsr2 [Mycobacteroides abscessus]|uniref:histone-like nucleoid-structuring protein Lsr2 n=1 Tax=Mycobacteroides abscessus TaxID=36809 RepID=UPI00092CBECE|nr:Lsr2 family protein [Mycobacteroides abscessus]SHQ48873.1 DNA-bridging protein Lsr2 [Mycobacteroides abscessus subsp. bolletii]SHR75786.1 DNA-bridging protein Lsr2 [Mycobacteroides abscessus subsp. bolletii]SHS69983.1 DNA-bridging protein Lsr2 [Mycobacteroides abscessus subsp. bolletii]SKF80824.1 DNA-bridging protein Lsr2 [Mycobacteroides abscessus subsp. bolletii]SKG67598.1 DNA-bridging protein Lsr2 [Mycobacteroides abscessus subsp. bolletii]